MQKLTLTLSDKDYQTIEELAKSSEMSKTDVVRQAVNFLQFCERERANQSRILVERQDGQIREVISR